MIETINKQLRTQPATRARSWAGNQMPQEIAKRLGVPTRQGAQDPADRGSRPYLAGKLPLARRKIRTWANLSRTSLPYRPRTLLSASVLQEQTASAAKDADASRREKGHQDAAFGPGGWLPKHTLEEVGHSFGGSHANASVRSRAKAAAQAAPSRRRSRSLRSFIEGQSVRISYGQVPQEKKKTHHRVIPRQLWVLFAIQMRRV